MTALKTTPTAADAVPLPTDEIHAALRSGVLRLAREGDLEDLLQDAWVALLERLPKLEGVKPRALPAYIRRIGYTAAVDSLRSQHSVRRGQRFESVPAHDVVSLRSRAADPETTSIARLDLRNAVLRAARPGTRSRGILALVFLCGFDAESAAAQLGMNRNSVYGTVSRARAWLQQRCR